MGGAPAPPNGEENCVVLPGNGLEKEAEPAPPKDVLLPLGMLSKGDAEKGFEAAELNGAPALNDELAFAANGEEAEAPPLSKAVLKVPDDLGGAGAALFMLFMLFRLFMRAKSEFTSPCENCGCGNEL